MKKSAKTARIAAMLSAAVMSTSLIGCTGGDSDTSESKTSTTEASTTEAAETSTDETATSENVTETGTETTEYKHEDEYPEVVYGPPVTDDNETPTENEIPEAPEDIPCVYGPPTVE